MKKRIVIVSVILCALFIGLSLNAHAGGQVTDCNTYGSTMEVGTLAWALQGGGEITFQCSGEIIVPRIDIKADTVIDANGNDVILSGGNTNYVIWLYEGFTLDLVGLKITKAKDGSIGTYGAIYNNAGLITLTDCSIFMNETNGLRNDNGTMIFTRVLISDNTRYGVWNFTGTMTLIDSVISGNAMTGLRNWGGTVTVDNCVISGNTASSGAGIINSNLDNNNIVGKMTITNTTVSDNEATFSMGGGIQNSGELTVFDSEVIRNSVTSNFPGGGVHNSSSGSINIINTLVSENLSKYGAGVYNNGGNLTIQNSIISENIAEIGQGGGIAYCCSTDGTTNLINTMVINNSAAHRGGGIDSYGGTITIENSTISKNYSGAWGGGINSSVDTTMTITNSTISDNTAVDHSGGINNSSNTEPLIITNSTISGNSALQGGGIRNYSSLILNQVTFYGNSASQGSNLFVVNSTSAATQITNSLIAGGIGRSNCADPGTQYITDGGFNISDDDTCNLNHPNSLTNSDAGLDPELTDNGGFTQTHALFEDSPAIDWIPIGTNGCGDPIVSDQRGVARPQGDGCDIGAYELALVVDNDVPIVSNVQVNPNPSPANSEVTLTATIDDTLKGNSNIAFAEYNVNGGDWIEMYPVDGTFDSPVENVSAKILFTESQHGSYRICVSGGDVFDNISEPECTDLIIEPASNSMHVNSIDGVIKAGKKTSTLTATVQVVDKNRIPIHGVVVYAQISNPADGTGSVSNVNARTNKSGLATFRVSSSIPSWKICVTDFIKNGYIYVSSDNIETCNTFNSFLPLEN